MEALNLRNIYEKHKRAIDQAAFFALITSLIYALFTFLWSTLAPFFIGLVIALIMEPIIKFLQNKLRFKRWIAAIVGIIIFLTAIGGIGTWLVNTLIRQVTSFVGSVPEHVQGMANTFESVNHRLRALSDMLPGETIIPDIEHILTSAATGFFGDLAMLQIILNVPNFFIGLILTLVSAFLYMLDGENIFAFLKRSCPKWLLEQFKMARASLSAGMKGFLRAQYILMTIVGLISLVGLLILGNPYALLFAILLAVLDFLPVVGTGAVFLPWALLSLITGDFVNVIGLVIIYAVITITRQVLQPKLLGSQMGVHPLASIMSIFIGFRIFGLLGLVLGPTVLMLFIAIRSGPKK